MKYFVSRQNYWDRCAPEASVVEVAIGGLDYANPDMMGVKWTHLGEGREFTNPVEAVEAAIAICEEWRKEDSYAMVGMGATMGFTMSFDGQEYDDLRKRAQEMYDKLPKCAQCGELMGKESYTHDLNFDDEKFCSENCAEKSYHNTLLHDLHARANDILNDASLNWEEKYDEIFSDDISVKVFNLIRLNYCDPDTTYQEDVEAFMSAFNQAMEKR
jgi:hypothetical protein